MARYRLYSDRLKDAARAGTTDVYQYDNVPDKVRVQIRQIVTGSFGSPSRYVTSWKDNPAALKVRQVVCHEQGKDSFGYEPKNPMEDLALQLENASTEDFLNTLEVCCFALTHVIEKSATWRSQWDAKIDPTDAIDDINFRLRDAGVGYQIEEGDKIVRVDSHFAHAEMVKPALTLLNLRGYEGPQAEFLNAHEHYRSGRFKEAITEGAKAFESLMKAVCDQKGWEYKKGARASDLLKVLRAHALWPDYLDGSFDQLIATLASGLPQVRNEDGAHGQGSVRKEVPGYVAAYALHLAASKMILISSAANNPEAT
jgi:hypothetical protein